MIGNSTDNLAISLARVTVYRYLAGLLRHPAQSFRQMRLAVATDAFETAIAILRNEAGTDGVPLGFGELPVEDLNVDELIKCLHRPPDDLFFEFDRVFGIGPTVDCPPYETEFCNNHEPFYRAQQMADVAGFYRAFGLQVARNDADRPDHIALEFEFMSFLVIKQRLAEQGRTEQSAEHAAVCRSAQIEFLRDHLVWWVPS